MITRISKQSEGQQTIIHVDGRLRVEVVPELKRECQSVHGPLVLDLSRLIGADRAGIDKIREWVSRGGKLRSPSRYLQLVLDSKYRSSDSGS